MSYIGAQPTTAAFVTDTFSANGSGTVFTLSVAPANTNSILVAVSGVLQDPSTYSVSGTTLTFSAAPPAGTGNISVRFLGIPASGVTNTAYRTQTEFTATAGQTTFSVPSYTVGYIDVYRNGALLGSADFTATNGTTVVLAAGASAGDLIETVSFYVSSVLNAIPAQNNAVIDSYILSMAGSKLTGTQVIPKATLPTGSVLQVVSTTKTDTFTTTSTSFTTVTGLTANITPTSSSSRILIVVSVTGSQEVGTNDAYIGLFRDSTQIALGDAAGSRTRYSFLLNSSNAGWSTTGSVNFFDSPATTSAITYSVRARVPNSGTLYINRGNTDADSGVGAGRTVSSITVMEIAG